MRWRLLAVCVALTALLQRNDECCVLLCWGFSGASTKNVEFRAGTASDSFPIACQLAKELMNPLGVNGERFLVASTTTTTTGADEDPPAPARRIGWAQIRPLPVEAQIQKETDDAMWDAFESDDTIQVPVGRKSLPWTEEYRDFAKQATTKRQQNAERGAMLRETRRETPRLYELASVWVDPSVRRKGIGTELVRRALQRHCREKGNVATNVYLLTLASTAGWYRENFGFRLVASPEDIPSQMAFEVQAGKLITRIIGAELVCMQGTEATGKL